MRRRVLVLLSSAAVPLVALAADEPRTAIEAVNRRFEQAVAQGDASAVARLYAPDAELLPPGAPRVSGRAAIEQFWKTALGEGMGKLTLTTREVYAVKDTAVEVGSWRVTNSAGKSVDGKAVVVWKKVGGTWMLARDIWNADMPPAPPPATK
jgi:uncharacterized protein (TIGR02246 family)